jgi:hypothetical protein
MWPRGVGDMVRRIIKGGVAALTIAAVVVAAAVTCETRNWQPVTPGDFKRVIFATADRKIVIDQTAGAADVPHPDPPMPPAITERIPPAVPRKEDEEDDG